MRRIGFRITKGDYQLCATICTAFRDCCKEVPEPVLQCPQRCIDQGSTVEPFKRERSSVRPGRRMPGCSVMEVVRENAPGKVEKCGLLGNLRETGCIAEFAPPNGQVVAFAKTIDLVKDWSGR